MDEFALPSDSSFSVSFDCSVVPAAAPDTAKKTNVVSEWFANMKLKRQQNAAIKDSIAKASPPAKKEKHPLLKKLKHKGKAQDATQ
jgi:hypothetical protein